MARRSQQLRLPPDQVASILLRTSRLSYPDILAVVIGAPARRKKTWLRRNREAKKQPDGVGRRISHGTQAEAKSEDAANELNDLSTAGAIEKDWPLYAERMQGRQCSLTYLSHQSHSIHLVFLSFRTHLSNPPPISSPNPLHSSLQIPNFPQHRTPTKKNHHQKSKRVASPHAHLFSHQHQQDSYLLTLVPSLFTCFTCSLCAKSSHVSGILLLWSLLLVCWCCRRKRKRKR